ncbi:MAG: porin family protein [Gemmatimonadetes bacterium]|nr:porin family protein [Gemmatimonadota bacterium]
MKTALIAACSGLVLLVASTAAFADDLPPARWSVGGHVGWTHVPDSETNSLSLGASTRVRPISPLGAELTVDWRNDDLENGEIQTVPVTLSGLLYIFPNLHGTVGVGWYHTKATLDEIGGTVVDFDDSRWDAGLHVGGGIDIPLGPSATLTADAKYVFLGYELQNIADTIEVDADFVNVTVGLQLGIL